MFAGYRDHAMWAQSSRVQDPADGFACFKSMGYEDAFERIMWGKEAGKSQEEYRLFLPVTTYCRFVTKISFRKLVKLCDYAWWLAHNAENDANALLFRAAANMLAYATEWPILEYCQQFGEEKCWPNFNDSTHADIIMISSYNFFAQLIRHRQVQVFSDLESMCLGPTQLGVRTMDSKVAVRASASMSAWRGIAAKRNCWIADQRVWGDALKNINNLLAETPLPCDEGGCKWVEDNNARIDGSDPNPPCPKFTDHALFKAAQQAHAQTKIKLWQDYS